jgi:nitrite reductase/ring-hydroxylating ferredoxin subunit
MSDWRRLCALGDVPQDGTNGFLVETERGRFGAMVIRRSGAIRTYVNSCPHVGVPLDLRPGQFLNLERSHIICTTHGALFRIDDGYCVSGPCAGAHLLALENEVRGDALFIQLPEARG